MRALGDVWGELLASDRARTLVATAASALVPLLAAFGLYGTQRFLVNVGRREYAIRRAIGAGPRTIRRLVLQSGQTMGIPGLVSGAVLAHVLVAWLRDEFALTAVSPLIAAILVLVSIDLVVHAAALAPANHAARTAPAPLLREE